MPQPQKRQEKQESKEGEKVQSSIHAAIENGGKQLVEAAEQIGTKLTQNEATKTQIRRIYGVVKRMEMEGFNYHEFVMLKPKLAYAAHKAPALGLLRDALTSAIDAVGEDSEKFKRFVDLLEATVAYFYANRRREGQR